MVLAALLATATGCAPKVVPPARVATPPRFPEFRAPVVPDWLAGGPAAANQARGWQLLQGGDFRGATREFEAALTVTPAFYPADAGLGYVELARQDLKAALPHFDRALERAPRELSALLGRGQALLGMNREAEALTTFEVILTIDPAMEDIARRVEVLQFRGQQADLQRTRAAAQAGRFDEAVAGYGRAIAASPESAFLYRELAAVEEQTGATDKALEHLKRSADLEPGDAKVLTQIGDLLEARHELESAAKAYTEALRVEPNADVQAKLDRVAARLDFERLPEEYRAIPGSAQLTRGELAALIGVRLSSLVQQGRRRDTVLITDVRMHWAVTWILAVAQAGIMDPQANRTFVPRASVRRVDLAQVVSRLLTRVPAPAQGRAWQNARLRFSDLGAGHVAYPAASVAIASGVMETGPNNAFQPSRIVSGQEASDVIDKIAAMVPVANGRGRIAR
jgi:tetratricopeptide (TPR) repeat protein